MQSLMNGSECSTGASPLASLVKHGNQDSVHQHLHSGPGGPSSLAQQSIRSRTPLPANNGDAERFFQAGLQQQGGPGGPGGAGGAFAMEALRRDLLQAGPIKGDREWTSQYSPAGAGLNPAEIAHMEEQFRQNRHSDFTSEYARQQHSVPGPSFSATCNHAGMEEQSYQQQQQRSGFAPSYGAYGGGMGGMGMGGMGMSQFGGGMMGMGGMGMASQMNYGHGGMGQTGMEQEVQGKGKARFVELDQADWEAEFAKVGAATTDPTTRQFDESATEAVEETVNLLEDDAPLNASESDAALMASLEKTWSNLQSTLNEGTSASEEEMAAWEAQYGSNFADQINGDSGLGDDLLLGDELGSGTAQKTWNKDNVDDFLSDGTPYPFVKENSYLGHPDPFSEGQRLLAAGAPLSEAALAFEAACQVDPGRAEAWKAVGETWAADEREAKGMRALEKAVACGGQDGLGAWMSLAVAYVNEGQELRALATLERWLNLAYPSLASTILPNTINHNPNANPWDTSNRIIDLFISAARAGPAVRDKTFGNEDAAAVVDPDVQVGLGVLFYSNSEYEKAKDCFEAALTVRPNDFLLWNRLGATLANGGLPEDAISAYRKALELRPTFTRATYNLGVSCLNIGCYQEAAEHLLAAIEGQMSKASMAAAGNGKGKGLPATLEMGMDEGSNNLWQTLRRAFLCMERHDLAEMAHPGTNTNDFRVEGFEFYPVFGGGAKKPHIYVGNLSPRVTEELLWLIFSTLGYIQSLKIVHDKLKSDQTNYAFLEFTHLDPAESALLFFNDCKIYDQPIQVKWANQASNPLPEPISGSHYEVFVGDLAPEISDEVLFKTFSMFGSLVAARVKRDSDTGRSRGYGFLTFRDQTDAEQAITAMDGEWLGKKPIRVNWATSRGGRDAGATGNRMGALPSPAQYGSFSEAPNRWN